jgi:hypothetical protein
MSQRALVALVSAFVVSQRSAIRVQCVFGCAQFS